MMMLVDCFLAVTPCRWTSCGKSRLGDGQPVLHQHLRPVQVGADLERDRQLVRAVAGAGGGHVEHALDAVDLLLDRRRHRVGQHLGIGARVNGRDQHRRGRDVGYCSIGSPKSVTTPTSIVMMAMTLAKIGRSIKKRESILDPNSRNVSSGPGQTGLDAGQC